MINVSHFLFNYRMQILYDCVYVVYIIRANYTRIYHIPYTYKIINKIKENSDKIVIAENV